MISDEMFRFDFSHPSKLSNSDLESINRFVNSKIKESIPLVENRDGRLSFSNKKWSNWFIYRKI